MQYHKRIAFFDFDGTITTKDTLFGFIIYTLGWGKFILKSPLIAPTLMRYALKQIDNGQSKSLVLKILFANLSYEYLDNQAQGFVKHKLHKYIKPEIMQLFTEHLAQQDKVVLVSANLEIYLKYWVAQFPSVDLIATKLDFQDNIFANGLAGKNCYAEEKVVRIKEYLQHKNIVFQSSFAYGNSSGDYAMLNFVNTPFWIEKNLCQTYQKLKKC